MTAMQQWCTANAEPLLSGFLTQWMEMNGGALLQREVLPIREEVLRQQAELGKLATAHTEIAQLREEVKGLKSELADANSKIQSLLLTNLHPPGSSSSSMGDGISSLGASEWKPPVPSVSNSIPFSQQSSAPVQPVLTSPVEVRHLGLRKSLAGPRGGSGGGGNNPDLLDNSMQDSLDLRSILMSRVRGQHMTDVLPTGKSIPILTNAPGPGEEVSSDLDPLQRDQQNKFAADARGTTRGKGTHGSIDIIVVEDVGVAQKLAHAALTRGHYKVEVAGDGPTAIELFKKHMGSLKAVLMDIQLPGMSGTEATQAIRQIERERGVAPVLIYGLTGNVSAEDLINYKAAGMNGCILKGKLLADAVRQAMEESQNGVEFVNLCDKQNASGRTVIAPTPSGPPKSEQKQSDLPPGPAGASAPMPFKIGLIKNEVGGIGTPRAPEPRSLMKTKYEGSGVRSPGVGLPHASNFAQQPAAPSGPNMLLVEDVRVSQKVALQALQRAGYKVIAADNGEAAVEKYKQNAASLRYIIMDINLPGISGIEATEQIRALERQQAGAGDHDTPPVLVFGLTGNVDPESMRNYEAAGMNGCILKGKVLAEAVGKSIEQSRHGEFANIS